MGVINKFKPRKLYVKNAMESNYQEMPTEELIKEFISAELRVPHSLAKEICSRPDSTPYLARIIEEDKYWELGGPGDAWFPLHALFLLSGIKTEESLKVLIDTLLGYWDDIGDLLTESMPSILANFGPLAIEPLKEVILDDSLDPFVRGAVSSAMAVIAHKNSKCQKLTIELFRKILKDAILNADDEKKVDSTFISLLVDDLSQFKDKEAIEDIKMAFVKGLVEGFFIDIYYVKEIYEADDKDLPYHRDDRDPIDHFTTENIERFSKMYGFDDGKKDKKTKIGRNDPCPCGSKKKYKKCCLKKEKNFNKIEAEY